MDRFRVADLLLEPLTKRTYRLFVTHHFFTGACVRLRLSSTTLAVAHAADGVRSVQVSPNWQTLFDADPCLASHTRFLHESGGSMLMDGSAHLLLTVGNFARWSASQRETSHFGKLLRVNIETGDAEIVASGLRNAQGLARDRDGNLWETEHGPQGGDELNLIESGSNYGWPRATYGVGYEGKTWWPADQLGRHDGFARPAFAWVPSIGVASIVVNDERFLPLWADDLLIASLSGQPGLGASLYRVRRHGVQVQYVEQIYLGMPIRDIAQMAEGTIALLGDSGKVLFLSRAYGRYCGANAPKNSVYAVDCPTEPPR